MKIRNTGLRVKRLAPKDLCRVDGIRSLIALMRKYSYRPWVAILKQTSRIIAHAQTKKGVYEQFSGGINHARKFFKVQRRKVEGRKI